MTLRRPSRGEKAAKTRRLNQKKDFRATQPVKPYQPRKRKPRKGRLDARGMKELRLAVFERSHGYCELVTRVCEGYVEWERGHLCHIKSRGAGGTDSLNNVLWGCPLCHFLSHQEGIKLQPKFSEDEIRRDGLPKDVMGLIHDLCYHHDGRNVWNYVSRAQEILRKAD